MKEQSFTGDEIAVIGIGGRFPKSRGMKEYWENILNGNECITFFEEEELRVSGIEDELLKNPNYVKAYGYLDGATQFEHEFFQYTERDAMLMDPQMRLLHEVVWETIEDAGYNPEVYEKKIGLYLGAADNLYWQVISTAESIGSFAGNFAASQINNKDFLATQIAYKMNFKGPAVTMSSACSTSLLTVHIACEALLAGDCDIALAGGAAISLPEKKGYLYEEGMILSPDGHCRAFDVDSSGTVGGNGVGVVALKLLEDAIKDKDHIHAVIRGSAINNDGNRKVGYSAPSIDGQAEVIRMAQKVANTPPETIGYVEAHGTATRLGDPVEVEALKQAFRTNKKNYCALGSVKSNIGHTDIAAGMASFLKAVLMLENKVIPPAVNFSQLNSHIQLENSPFYVNTKAKMWNDEIPFRIGISSFGIGGTNVHVILEEAPNSITNPVQEEVERNYIFPFSAQDGVHGIQLLDKYKIFLEENENCTEDMLRNIAYTLQIGRKTLSNRISLVAKEKKELLAILNKELEKPRGQNHSMLNPDIVFMFPGQGAQYADMGADLSEKYPIFKENFNRCLEIASQIAGKSFESIIFGAGKQEEIYQTDNAHIYIFSFEYALAKLLVSFGIQPSAMIGHSLGEYVAACLSGVFRLEDAIYIIVERGRLMKALPEGTMLSIQADIDEIKELLDDSVSIASINSSKNIVLSGTKEGIEQIKQVLTQKNISFTTLHTSRAFHSKMMDEMLEMFRNVLSNIQFGEPKLRYISCYTGEWINNEVMTLDYWCQQLRHTVMFEAGISTILKERDTVFLEVGPGTTLTSFVNDIIAKQEKTCCVYNLVRHVKENIADDKYLLKRIGQLWENGIDIDWSNFWTGKEKKISLPVYPFQGKEFMIHKNPFELLRNGDKESIEHRKNEIKNWLYIPSYHSENLTSNKADACTEGLCLLFVNDDSFSNDMVEFLKSQQKEVVTVKCGTCYSKLCEDSYMVNPKSRYDYETLWNHLQDRRLKTIIHMWNVLEGDIDFEKAQEIGFYSLLFIVNSFKLAEFTQNLSLTIVANGLIDITGNEKISVSKGTILGAMKVLPQELPCITSRIIDIDLEDVNRQTICQDIWKETQINRMGDIIAHRRRRWIQSYARIEIPDDDVISIVKNDVIIITGGLGQLGKLISTHLVHNYQCKISFFVYNGFPDRLEWENYLNHADNPEKIKQSIKMLLELENEGAEFIVIGLDILQENEFKDAIAFTERKLGAVKGIIHMAGKTDIHVEDSTYETITIEECHRQMDAKVLGARTIEKSIEGKDIKFCILFSSLASILGGYGFLAYSAANSYLDVLVKQMSKTSKTRWISVNWDNWNIRENEKNPLAIEPEEGLKVLDKLFMCNENQVLVSTYNLQKRIDKWVLLKNVDRFENQLEMLPIEGTDEAVISDDVIQSLKEIMESQLGKKDIDIDDNFFELGGDSLKALAIIALIRKRLNRKISLSDFFENPTIREMSGVLSVSQQKKDVPRAADKEYYRVCSSQERLYILNQMHKESLNYNLPQMILFEGKLDTKKFMHCINRIVTRHEALRTSFHYIDNEVLQQIHEEGIWDVQYLELSEQDVRKYVQKFIQPFQLDLPSAFRCSLIRISDEKFLFLFDCHHIISDGGAFKVFFEELADLYQGKELAEINIRYRDVCEYEHSESYLELMQKQKEFWLDEMKNEIPELSIPTDYYRKEILDYDGESVELTLDADTSKKISQFVSSHNTTKFVFFLTVYNVLLAKLSNQQDIIIGTPVARRSNPSMQNVFGHFLNVLPLRNYPMNDKTFEEFMEEVSKRTVKAFENEDFSFKSLVESLNVKWSRNRNPIFDTMIIMQNIQSNICNIPGIHVSSLPFESNSSKFDITLEIFEMDENYKFVLEYCTELFSKDTMENYTQYLKTIIETVINTPNYKLEEIRLSKRREIVNELSVEFDF